MTPNALSPCALQAQAVSHLQRYLDRFPAEAPGLSALQSQLAQDGAGIFMRKNMRGHITTSALVYDASQDAVLMIHHQVLDRWLQPGGHHEGEECLQASAEREAVEETGVAGLSPWPWPQGLEMPLDIDTHAIPANPAKGEGRHVHHDFIYLFAASSSGVIQPQWAEVKGVRWMARPEVAALPEARFARLARKLESLR